jgi:hypothetical protein
MPAIKREGHANYKKGLGIIALDPSLPRPRRNIAGAAEPRPKRLCLLGLLLWVELRHAFISFISFLNALLPDVEVAQIRFEDAVHM